MNKIKKEIDKIELPEELNQRTLQGVRNAREQKKSKVSQKPRSKRVFRYASFWGGVAASLLLIAVLFTGFMPPGGPLELLQGFRASNDFAPESDLASLESPLDPGEPGEELPVVGSREKLWELVALGRYSGQRGMEEGAGADDFGEGAAGAPQKELNYSSTNLQVQGVDEADIIKTDGEYIYQISGSEVLVSRVFPVQDMEVIKRIQLEEGLHPLQLYVDSRHLVVLGQKHDYPYPGWDIPSDDSLRRYYSYSSHLKVLVFDIADKGDIQKAREIEVDGYYISSRKIGSIVYLITNKWLDEYVIQENPGVMYRDTARGEGTEEIPLDQIRYFPEVPHNNYLIITSFDLGRLAEAVSVEAFLGSGENFYMSRESLYIAVSRWAGWGLGHYRESTTVFAFRLEGPRVVYRNRGEVPGRIINQFSMDEYRGYFRIATTTWEEKLNNHLFVLDQTMKVVGRVENIAPGERIYSARFMGDRGYLVTFDMIDPLFVIDLEVPERPKILGELKIPGFSTYLHPLDADHLLGIGRDTTVSRQHGREFVVELGLKLAIFDVSDVKRPVEKHVEIIGGAGTNSEVLHNHKALMFKDGLMAFPLTVVESRNPQANRSFDFQGAYVYRVDVNKGFDFLGGITHLEETSEFYYKPGIYQNNVERVFYIEGTMYTVSRKYIMANRLEGLRQVGLLKLPMSN